MVGWQTTALGAVLLKTETVNPAQLPNDEFVYIDVSSVSNETYAVESTQRLRGREAPSRARRQVRTGDVLLATIRPTLKRIAVIPPELDGQVCSTGYFVLRPCSEIDHRFLFYWLFTEQFMGAMKSLQKGASYPAVTDAEVRAQAISFPTILEQQRIVSILDEAFEGIATVKANAEKNLQNARELFDSYLEEVLAQGGPGWLEASIADSFKVRSGDFLPAKNMVTSGQIRVYGGNGVAGFHNVSNLSGELIVIGRVGAKCGNVRHVSGEIWLTDNAFHISQYLRPFDPAFLARVLNLKNLRQTANQAAQPVISYTTIKDVMLSFPTSIEEQRSIAVELDNLEEGVDRLRALCERKLTALDDLKKSLLHQAFNGRL